MSTVTKAELKDGTEVYRIRYHTTIGGDPKEFRTVWNIPTGLSAKVIERKLDIFVRNFEQKCNNGEYERIKDRKERLKNESLISAADPNNKPFKQYCDEVFLPEKTDENIGGITKSTASYYRNFLVKHLYPLIGSIPIKDITSDKLQEVMNNFLKKGKSHSTNIGFYTTLNQVFARAYKFDKGNNPMQYIDRPKQSKDIKKSDCPEYFTVEEVQHIFECLNDSPVKWQVYIRLLLATGLRRGEACGIKWTDIDFKEQSIYIQRSYTYISKEDRAYFGTPKGGKNRYVYYGSDPELPRLLNKLRAEQLDDHKIISIAGNEKCEYVFMQDDSFLPMHPQSPDRYMSRFGQRYNIENFHPHKLRHTCGTLLLQNGADLKTVSEYLGHADIKITARYLHTNEDKKKEASQLLYAALNNINRQENIKAN